jgi:hypothetical protein
MTSEFGHPERVPANFGALNARYLQPRQIAEGFVPPPRFGELCNRGHTQLIGPRGSGKTTLLRMLDGAALEAWAHPRADEFRARIDYTGVFVPTDRTWSRQVEGIGEGLSDEHRALFGTAAFTTHMLKALVGAMHHRARAPDEPTQVAHRRVDLSPADEEMICGAVAKTWMLEEQIGTLESLAEALEDRLSDLDTVAQNEVLRGPEGRGQRLAELGYLGLQFVTASMSLIKRFDDAVGEPDGTWAFLIDEFELASPSVREQILGSLRGRSNRLLFKISMAPYAEESIVEPEHDSPTPINDFQILALTWPRKSKEEATFSTDLFTAQVERRALAISPIELLGRSEFQTEPDEHCALGTAYSKDSRLGKRLRDLANADGTFRGYLEEKRIDLDHLEELDGSDRASDVRKVVSLAAVRLEYRSSDERQEATGQVTKPRKNPLLYCGASTVFEMTEGNPRWFIAIVGKLMDYYKEDGDLPKHIQAREIRHMSNLFRSVLRSIPARHEGAPTVLSILDRIGEHFHEWVVRAAFNADPPGSFRVTAATDHRLHEPLRLALNAGAIIHVPPQGEDPQVLSDLTGHRFRLAYLLAPSYEIPVRLGRETEISSISPIPPTPDHQLSLEFDDQLAEGETEAR